MRRLLLPLAVCFAAAHAFAGVPFEPGQVATPMTPLPVITLKPSGGSGLKITVPPGVKVTLDGKPLVSGTAGKLAKAKATPTPVPVRTPDRRPKQGKAKDGFSWRVRPYRIPVGVWPKAIRIAPDGKKAYVTNFDSQSVSVLDLESQKIEKTIDLGDNAVEADFSQDASKLYVSGWLHDEFYILDRATYEIEKIRVGDKPKGVTTAPDGKRVYVVNWAGDSVSLVDLETKTVVSTIGVGGVPRWIAIAGTAQEIGLVANFRGKSISVIDLAASKEVAKITKITNPRHIVVSVDGRTAYVTDREAGKLHAIDVYKRKIKWSVAVGERPKTCDVTADGKYVFTANYGSHDVSVVRLSDHKVIATIPVGISPSGLEITPDGTTVYTSNWYDYDLSVIDIAYPDGARAALPESIPTPPPGSRAMNANGSFAKKLVTGSSARASIAP